MTKLIKLNQIHTDGVNMKEERTPICINPDHIVYIVKNVNPKYSNVFIRDMSNFIVIMMTAEELFNEINKL